MSDSRILEFSDGSKLYSGSCVSSVQGDGNCSKSELKDFVEYVHGRYSNSPIPLGRKCDTTSETVSFIGIQPKVKYCYVRQSNVTVKDVILHWKLTGQCNVFLSNPHNIQNPSAGNQRNIRKMKGYGLLVYGKVQTRQMSRVYISSRSWRDYGYGVIYVYPIKDFKPFNLSFNFSIRCLEGRIKTWNTRDKVSVRSRLQQDLMERPEYLLESLSDFYCLGQNEKVFGPGYNKIEWIEH